MPDDIKLQISADPAAALDAIRKIVSAATAAEATLNKAIDSAGKSAGTGGLPRIAQDAKDSKSAIDAFNASVDNLVKSFKNLSREAQAALATDIRRLPTLQGKIELSKIAGQPVSARDLNQAERTLQNIRTGLESVGASTRELRDVERQLQAVRNTRTAQQEAKDLERQAAAAEKAAAAEERLRQRETSRLQTRARKTDQQIAQALLPDQPAASTQTLLQRGIDIQSELASRGFRQAATMANIYRGALGRLSEAEDKEVASIRKQIAALEASIDKRKQLGQLPTGQQLVSGVQLNQTLLARGQTLGDPNIIAEATAGQQKYGDELERSRFRLNEFNKAFGQHAQRIVEGLFIYNALGRALGGVNDAINLVAESGVEFTRFEQVVGDLPTEKLNEFQSALGRIAIATNTPFKELVSTNDLVASSLREVGDTAEQVATNVERFQEIAGRFSNVIGKAGDQQQVTEQLTSIFRQVKAAGGDLSDFSHLMDQVVVAGNRSAVQIGAITDGLTEIGPVARQAGVGFDFLAAVIGEVNRQTSQSGQEIGTAMRTLIAHLTNTDEVTKAFDDIGKGIVKVTDATGKLLPAQQILENFFAAAANGDITAQQVTEILQALGQQIQPGQFGLNAEVFRAIGVAMVRLKGDVGEAKDALKDLSDVLVGTLQGRLGQLARSFEVIIATGFAEPIKQAVGSVAGFLQILANLLGNKAVQDIVQFTVKWGIFLLGIAAGRAILTRFRQILTLATSSLIAMANPAVIAAKGIASIAGVDMGAAVTASGQLALGLDSVAKGATIGERAMIGLKAAAIGAATALKSVLPVLLATLVAEHLGDIANIPSEVSALSFAEQHSRAGLHNVRISQSENPLDVFGRIGADITGVQQENIRNLISASTELQSQNKLTAESFKKMDDLLFDTNGAMKNTGVSVEDFTTAVAGSTLAGDENSDALWKQITAMLDYKNASERMTDQLDAQAKAELRSSEALKIGASLTEERVAALANLTDELNSGNITQEDFSDRFNSINSAADLAARAVVAFGDKAAQKIPGVAEIMTRTGATVQEALFKMFQTNPAALSNLEEIISTAEQFQSNIDQIKDNVKNSPITPTANPVPLATGAVATQRIMRNYVQSADAANRALSNNPVTPIVDLNPAVQQLTVWLKKILPSFLANPVINKIIQMNAPKQGTQQLDSALNDFLSALRNLFSGVEKAPSKSDIETAKQPQQSTIVDIGDLPESSIKQIIAIAAAAQKKVVAAGGTVDTKETAAIFKGTQFEQLVKGIDQRFLTKAIEELTNVEKKRLELEQQRLQDVTRNLVTRVGPVQSLVSAPVLAAGGGVLSGQGLNADPRLGNFTINVPINWSGMSLKDLQNFIVKSIAQAWIDAGRGG